MSTQEYQRCRKLFRTGGAISGLDDHWDIFVCMEKNHVPYGVTVKTGGAPAPGVPLLPILLHVGHNFINCIKDKH